MRNYDETGSNPENLYFTHDRMKNVIALFGSMAGRRALYEYAPNGAVIRAEGDVALVNPFRFSSEYHDDELGLVYYNYRYLNTREGRWIGRDPIFEKGGSNLYAFLKNSPTLFTDLHGLQPSDNFSEEAKEFIKKNCKCFLATGRDIEEMSEDEIIAAAMAIAEELSTRSGGKQIIDSMQDWLGSKGWTLFHTTDIGKGNINEYTAKNVDTDSLNYPEGTKEALKKVLQNDESRRKFLVTDEGTVMIGLLEMKSMSKKTAPYMPDDMESYKKAQVNVNAWREGEKILERMEDGKNRNPESYEPSPGPNLEQYKANYDKIKELLQNCK